MKTSLHYQKRQKVTEQVVQVARLCLAQGLGSLTRHKQKRQVLEDSYVILKQGLQLEGYCNWKVLEEGKCQLQ